MKRERKSYIINISKEYSIVSQFTSFVAIEEREKVSLVPSSSSSVLSPPSPPFVQGEKFDVQKGPSIEELVAEEAVDKLVYVGWMVDQGRDPKQVGSRHTTRFKVSIAHVSRTLWTSWKRP